MRRLQLLALTSFCLCVTAESAQTPIGGSEGYSPQFLADYKAAYDACAKRIKPQNTTMIGGGNSGLIRSVCDAEAKATAKRMEASRALTNASAQSPSSGVLRPASPVVPVDIGREGAPGSQVQTTAPALPEYGLTIEVPVKITNFRRNWAGNELAKDGDQLTVFCRQMAGSANTTFFAYGVGKGGWAYLPAPKDGESIEQTVRVGMDIDLETLDPDDTYAYQCFLLRPGAPIPSNGWMYRGAEMKSAVACGDWTEGEVLGSSNYGPCYTRGDF